MYRRIIIFLFVLAVAGLMATTVFARNSKSLKIKDVSWDIGSLIAEGDVTGLGNEDATVTLDASGTAVTTCINPGGNEVPGQTKSVSAEDSYLIQSGDITKNGRAPFTTEAEANLSAREAGCPNGNWTVDMFTFWEEAILTIEQGDQTVSQTYTCETTRNPDRVTCVQQ